MIQKHISLPEELDQRIRERVKRLNQPEEQVITQLIEEGLNTPKQWKNAGDALSSWTCIGSVDCLRLRTVRGKESIATNKPGLPTGVSPRSYPAG